MKKTWTVLVVVAAAASMGTGGCDGDDARLAKYAQNSVDQQSRQNEQIARQNHEVTQQNRHVAEAAQKLVAADSQARRELIAAQKALQEGLQAERTTINDQRQVLEQERQAIARERYWEPIVAEAIGGFGVLVACLAPLWICFKVLHHEQADRTDVEVLNELLLTELTAEGPRLLTGPEETVAAIPHDPPADDLPPVD